MAATDTLDFLQQQVEAADALESIESIEPMEIMPSDLFEGDALDGDTTGLLSDQVLDTAIDADEVAVASDLQSSERVTAAASAGFDSDISISGRVLHDVNGDGSVDENIGLAGVEVRLYRDLQSGVGEGVLDGLDNLAFGFVTETTDINGDYEFTDVGIGETFFVVVNSRDLANNIELNAGYTADDVWGVQTYAAEGALFDRGNGQEVHDGGAFYGGYNAEQSDLPGLEHIIRRSVTTEDQSNVDFGFSFNVVTNTLAGGFEDHDPDTARTVQGSLRQFIRNANAIAGDNEMRFVPVVDASYTSTTGDIWQIEVEHALPTIFDSGTSINGLTYQTDGTLFATPESDVVPDGSVNGVGVDDSLLGPEFFPSLALSGLPNTANAGLIGQAEFFEVSNIAIVNFSSGIVIGEDASHAFIHDNFIGVHADGSQSTVAQTFGIVANNADDGKVFDNYIVNSRNTGILVSGSLDTGDQAENWIIENNYVLNKNFTGNNTSDGIGLSGGTDGAQVLNNRIENSVEFGIDLWNNRGSVTIAGNTVTDSGTIRAEDGKLVGGGIGLTSAGNVVRDNELIDNTAAGILVRGTADVFENRIQSATSNLISENYFENNATLDIDIIRPQDLPLGDSGALDIAAGDGMNANDGLLDADTGSNGIDHPVLTEVSLQNGVLTIEGSYLNLINDAQIELYLLGDNGSKRYFATINVADQTSNNPATGEFTAELAEPAGGWPSEFEVGSQVAAIIIDGSTSDTSEFSLATSVTLGNLPAFFDTPESTFEIVENTNFVENLDSTDPEGEDTTYSIVGGSDADLFNVRSDNGILRFKTAPDFENPADADANNDYSVIVRAQDPEGNGTDREFTVTVIDFEEIAEISMTEYSQLENQADDLRVNGIASDNGTFFYDFDTTGDAAFFDFVTDSNGQGTGEFSFVNAPDFENPIDENGDGIYSFTVTAFSTTGFEVTETINVTVTDSTQDNIAEIEETGFVQNENEIVVHQILPTANDNSEFNSFVFTGGSLDSFNVNETTGEFSLKEVPDFENPTDGSGDNVYSITVTATSETGYSVT